MQKIQKVYDVVIKYLPLNDIHDESLRERGIGKEQIELLEYKSWPVNRDHIISECLTHVDDLAGVPGFHKGADGGWKLAGREGIAIPLRAIDGTISAIKISPDKRVGNTKYIYLSSGSKKGKTQFIDGTPSKASVHFPIIEADKKVIRITEGELKADIATCLSGIYTISIPGITVWRQALDAVKELNPDKILLAFDEDKNKETSTSVARDSEPYAVGRALSQLYSALKEAGHDVAIEDWPEEAGKGIDDVWAAGKQDQIKLMSSTQADEFCEKNMSDTIPTDWTYIIGTKTFIHRKTMQELDKEQFSDYHASGFKTDKMAKIAILHPSFSKADKPVYQPRDKQIITRADGVRLFNMWWPSDIEPVEGDSSSFFNHIKYLLPKEGEADILLDFLAHLVQFPERKIHWAILLQGKQGTGKSYIGYVMSKILGSHNVSMPSNDSIHEPYTAWQKSCQLAIIEEVMARGRLDLMNKLKSVITQPNIMIREMYKAPYEQPNLMNMIMFTNHEDAIILEKDDRRYCVFYSPIEPLGQDYYTKLWAWTDAYIEAIAYSLTTRDITEFCKIAKGQAPSTESKGKLIEASRHPLDEWIQDGIELRTYPFMVDIVSAKDIAELVPSYLKGVSINKVSRALTEAGARPLGQVDTGWGRVRVVSIRNHELLAQTDSSKIKETYLKFAGQSEPGNAQAGVL